MLFFLFAKNLKKIGIDLKITVLEPSDHKKRISQGDFDISIWSISPDYLDLDNIFAPLLSGIIQKQNLFPAQSNDIRALLLSARRERNENNRQKIYYKINQTLIVDGLIIPLFVINRSIISNQKLRKIQTDPFGRIYLFDLKYN